MRKVEQQMLAALINCTSFKSGNTEVRDLTEDNAGESMFMVFLHGNKIAEYWPDSRRLNIYDGGWESVTTKGRLNALLWEFAPAYGIMQKNWQWFLVEADREVKSQWNGKAEFCMGAKIAS